jgi:predicted metalloprotease
MTGLNAMPNLLWKLSRSSWRGESRGAKGSKLLPLELRFNPLTVRHDFLLPQSGFSLHDLCMLWQGQRESDNVEDERGAGGGGGGRIAIGGGVGGIILLVLYLVLGGDPKALVDSTQQAQISPASQVSNAAPRDEASKFVAVVLADTEDAWHEIFRQMGRNYEEPKLVLFTNQTQSGCGFASGATGPFYCPQDRRVYIDLGFYRLLQERLGAGGDFAQAYVIAHEVGHHVQNLLGITEKVDAARGRVSQSEYNRLSVRLELQADFLAGVWARYADRVKRVVESGDIEEAMRAASAVGDDRLQRQARGYVVPDSFTHGTSEQRLRWFRRGYETGDLRQGDTFNARDL